MRLGESGNGPFGGCGRTRLETLIFGFLLRRAAELLTAITIGYTHVVIEFP
jgi:hypothetical protein